ncbi:MAG: primosomal protein N' [Bacteroidales bacterium]|nr:primosomal protein N' [Bacteroidales bacterium]
MERKTLFVDVLLPLHLPDTYTYRVPFEYNDVIAVGQRVVVQFGSKRLYAALVRRVHDEVPGYTTKYVLSILDLEPIVGSHQFAFWDWMASYYMCYAGDVMAVALPSAFRLSSESFIVVHPDFSGEYGDLNENEISVLDVLARQPKLPIGEVAQIVGFQKIMPLIKTMIDKKIIVMEEELQQRYTPKSSTWLALAPAYAGDEALRTLLAGLEKKASLQKQLLVMLKFLQLSKMGAEEVKKRDLAGCKELSPSALNTLISKEILLPVQRTESRLEEYANTTSPSTIVLNDEQQRAFDTIVGSTFPVNLLHGVTASGKTEVYIKLIDRVLSEGKQVLFLLPEIALTAQVINRLRKYFGTAVGVYHSRFTTQERAEVWQRTAQQTGGFQLLVGARSALFLPFHDLGLVIVDEEHDSSFKQNEPAPRYNGRDSAIYLAHLWGARTVLGSATPSLESYFNARNGKYGFAEMTQRYGGVQMPEVLCVDMRDAQRKGEVRQNFSDFLVGYIRQALERKEQVILFQNRRGFSLRIECDTCHWVPQCKHCDVSLVYHKATHSMRCHYCGYSIPVPEECPACHSSKLKMKGFGTERIEDDISILFPDAHVARMDLDTTAQKNRYLEILNDFEERKIDILVGTQMITKGLDFRNVSVVGILSADNLISFPDFRAYERSFQQMTQVSGRAGRQGTRGKVIIQTYQPYHQAIRDSMANDYQSMYSSQITERRVFRYPPYYKLIVVTLKHKDQSLLDTAAARYAASLRGLFATRVMGPEYPSVMRIRNQYIKKIMVRFERSEPLATAKKEMLRLADKLTEDKQLSRLIVQFDVDPL